MQNNSWRFRIHTLHLTFQLLIALYIYTDLLAHHSELDIRYIMGVIGVLPTIVYRVEREMDELTFGLA